MRSRRRSPAFLLVLLLFALLATLLMAFLPGHEVGEVKTTVVHRMVATMDGWMHRFGIPQELTANLAGRIPWGWLGLLGAAAAAVTAWEHRRRRG
jgi:hypothetical protein